MNEHIGPLDFTAMGKDYLTQADVIAEKIAQLKREYKHTGKHALRVQMDNWKEIEADLRRQGLDFLRRGERRRKQDKEAF